MAPPPPSSLAFAAPVTFSSGGTKPGSIALADFNGDGKLDIVVSNFFSNTVAVFLNNGDGTFQAPIVSPVQITGVGLGALVVGDFNQDGKPDLVIATIAGSQADIVLLGNGDGTFRQLAPIPTAFGFIRARVADLNGDGHLDLVTSENPGVSVFLGNGDGTFTPTTFPTNLAPATSAFLGLVVGDFNGNGKLDIVALEPGSPFQPGLEQGALLVYSGNGDGSFNAPNIVSVLPSFPGALASADFAGNGKKDLLIGFPNSAGVALGNGDGTFQLGTGTLLPVYDNPHFDLNNGMSLQTADLNLDGKPDALVADYENGILALVLNDAIGKTNPPQNTRFEFTLAPGLSDIAVGDLNGDGLPNVVVSNALTNTISIILSHRH